MSDDTGGSQLSEIQPNSDVPSNNPTLEMKENLAFGGDYSTEGEDFTANTPEPDGSNVKPAKTQGDNEVEGGEQFTRKPAKQNRNHDDATVEGGERDYADDDEIVGGEEHTDENDIELHDKPQRKPEPKADDAPAAEDKAKGKSAIQKRIDQLTFERREAERKLAEKSAPVPAAKADDVPKGDKPQLFDYESTEDYEAALKDYESRGTPKPVQPSDTGTKAAPPPYDANLEKAKDRIANDVDALEKYPDFLDVLGQGNFPPVLAHICADLDNPGEAAYLLAQNQDFINSLGVLSPAKQVLTVAKFVESGGKTGSAPAAPAAKKSKAPPPIVPVKQSAPADAEKDWNNLSVSEMSTALRGRGGIEMWD